jgi:hypothetical protein
MRFILGFKNKNNGAPKDALYTIMVVVGYVRPPLRSVVRSRPPPFLLLSLARPENYLFQF